MIDIRTRLIACGLRTPFGAWGGVLVLIFTFAATLRANVPTTVPTTQLSLRVCGGTSARMTGRQTHLQILATLDDGHGNLTDATRTAVYRAEPAGIVSVSATGSATSLANGAATITATASGATASVHVDVEHCEAPVPINFANQVVPIFTKAGCNTGGCHGKSSGQNGFRLSLMGFEPAEDYEHLVFESRGRRLSPAAPEHSLLLLKATAMLPHGGGKRLDTDSDDYKLLTRWISQGMPTGSASDPSVASIELFPTTRTIPLGGEQQLLVTARYTDGSMQDVTRDAVFQSSDKQMAAVDAGGHVTAMRQPGSVSVMVRYQGKVAAFQATLPLGAPVDHLPVARNFIDEIVFRRLMAMGMPASEVCDDATFLRRLTLDITGQLPTVAEATEFLADADPAKRDKCIDRLLACADYADYFANKWSALLRNKRVSPDHQSGNYLFHDWIRDSFYDNKPYDQFVREILTASGDVQSDPPTEWFRQVATPTAQMEDTAQLFLGTRIQCAQCHHHPYEKWSQQDYYSLAAFFSQVARAPVRKGEELIFINRSVAGAMNLKTGQPVKPAGLGAATVDASADDDARTALVDWMETPDNKFFAPALVNRYWKHFLGRGLVEPEDDMRETNPPTNPELLAALASHFVRSKFDLQDLIRTICRSSTYQLSAIPNQFNVTDKQNYSRYYPKRMTAEVLYDAVNAVTAGTSEGFPGLPAGMRAVQLPDNSFNASSYFLTVFGRPESSSACACERSQDASLAQSLHLLNSQDVMARLAGKTGRPAELVADHQRGDEQKVRGLYLLTFSRPPNAEEMGVARAYLQRKSAAGKTQEGYEDIVWALINTKEFLFNH